MNILENLLECPFPTVLSFAGLFPNYRRVINRKQRELKEVGATFPRKSCAFKYWYGGVTYFIQQTNKKKWR